MRVVLIGLMAGCSIFEAPPDSYSSDTGSTSTDTVDDTQTPTGDDSGSGGEGGDDTGGGFDCEQQVQQIGRAHV